MQHYVFLWAHVSICSDHNVPVEHILVYCTDRIFFKSTPTVNHLPFSPSVHNIKTIQIRLVQFRYKLQGNEFTYQYYYVSISC